MSNSTDAGGIILLMEIYSEWSWFGLLAALFLVACCALRRAVSSALYE